MISQETFEGTLSDIPASMAGIGTHEVVLGLIKEHLKSPALVADLAAGQGAFSLKLKESGHEIIAADFNRDSWKVSEIPLVEVNFDSEFSSVILKDNPQCDAIVAIEIIEHLENPFRFVRECAKLLKPNGLLFLTTPNVETVYSRLMFLYAGRLNAFGAYETVRPAHITPIFKWKLDMILDEARFETIYEGFNRNGNSRKNNIKERITNVASLIIGPFLKGEKGGEGRITVARLNL